MSSTSARATRAAGSRPDGSPPRSATLRVTTAPWARIGATHHDGVRVEVRADGHGHAVSTGLRPGSWTVVAHDARHGLCSAAVDVDLEPRGRSQLQLEAAVPTARFLIEVRGSDNRPVDAEDVAVTDATGRSVSARLRDGLAEVAGLRPGSSRVHVAPSLGHLGSQVDVEAAPGALVGVRLVSPVAATISGRVVQGAPQLAAVVALLDPDGLELERVRTDEHGRFVLGTGLVTTEGLTVVATTGPETLHVTRAAVADVDVRTGVRHHLGDIELPVAGRRATWTARARVANAMMLPSTHL